jgi:hypothetical protein
LHYNEFIAAGPGYNRCFTHSALQPLSGLPQYVVASNVPVLIVDIRRTERSLIWSRS